MIHSSNSNRELVDILIYNILSHKAKKQYTDTAFDVAERYMFFIKGISM